MKGLGLELQFNNKKIKAAIKKGVLTIVTSINTVNDNPEVNVDFKGLSIEENEHFTWADLVLVEGDSITIKVVETDQNIFIPETSID